MTHDTPAFPFVEYDGDGRPTMTNVGLMRRQYYAAKAMQGMLANPAWGFGGRTVSDDVVAKEAFELADAMIRAEQTLTPEGKELAEAREKIKALEALRPLWAQGYSSDSIAAQSLTTALTKLYDLLGVTNQTAAVAMLRALVQAPRPTN